MVDVPLSPTVQSTIVLDTTVVDSGDEIQDPLLHHPELLQACPSLRAETYARLLAAANLKRARIQFNNLYKHLCNVH